MNGNKQSLAVATLGSGNGQGQSQKLAHPEVLLAFLKRAKAAK